MEPIKISLNDYVLSGGGANGESYDHKTDPSVMLKLYFPGKIQQPLDEMLSSRRRAVRSRLLPRISRESRARLLPST